MSSLPFADIRIAELSNQLAGRLIGQMFADQGAEVYTARSNDPDPFQAYLNRGKIAVGENGLADTSFADVIITDGKQPVDRLPGQIVAHIVAALPGDKAYGYLPDDCSDDLINGIVGFYTDMGVVSRIIGREAIYTPLSLSSTYAAATGANHIAAALFDARRNGGAGRTVWVSRIAGGVAAVGALALENEGLPKHLRAYAPQLPQDEDTKKQLGQLVEDAADDPAKELILTQTAIALGSPYEAADGRFVMIVGAPNWRLTRRLLDGLGIYDQALALGLTEISPFLPEVLPDQARNLADSMNMALTLGHKLSRLVAEAFKTRPAAEWERYLSVEHKVPCVVIHDWDEWQKDESARQAGIFARVEGLVQEQIGRVGWVRSAQPYPPLKACREGQAPKTALRDLTSAASAQPNNRPLAGLRVADFTNVIAGPNNGRMLAELGADVIKIDPAVPYHDPTVMVVWPGESGANKRSIILDMHTDEGREIMDKLVAASDIVVANKLDDQWERMGLGQADLDRLNPAIIQLALSAYRGDTPGSIRHDYPGYDPAIQGATGIMKRFGKAGAPSLHGVASCVDYLCGYLGVWAGLTALYAQQLRGDGKGDRAESSLAIAATFNQADLQYDALPDSAIGQYATGRSEGARIYQLSDGWIYAEGDHDLTGELSGLTRKAALEKLAEAGILASPVQTSHELAERHMAEPTPTVAFIEQESDGWKQRVFAASWFANENGPLGSPGPAHRIGSDGPALLRELGYSASQIDALMEQGIVGATEWQNIGLALERADRKAAERKAG